MICGASATDNFSELDGVRLANAHAVFFKPLTRAAIANRSESARSYPMNRNLLKKIGWRWIFLVPPAVLTGWLLLEFPEDAWGAAVAFVTVLFMITQDD